MEERLLRKYVCVQCVLDQQELVRRVTAVLEKGQGRIKAAVLDHIVSFPPVVLPLTELVAACRTVRPLLLPEHCDCDTLPCIRTYVM